jgi:ribosomal protein S18 acetylase RimI-like enzyme
MLEGFGDRALGASCRVGGTVVGVGYGVLADGWLGVFGMGTSSQHRRQGVATAVLAALRRVALARGAGQAYLQVETGNAPAIGLYEAAGFRISHGYHYRSEPSPPG